MTEPSASQSAPSPTTGGLADQVSESVFSSQSVSFSAFRAPSTIPLDPQDYVGWAEQMRAMFELAGMWHLVDPQAALAAEPEPRAASAASSSAVSVSTVPAASIAKIREAHFMLISALRDSESRRMLAGLPRGDPRALWLALERRFLLMPRAAVAALYSKLLSSHQENSESVRTFADRLVMMRHQLGSNGRQVSDNECVTAFLTGVLPSLSSQVSMFVNLSATATFEQVVEVARGEETRLHLTQRNAQRAPSTSSALGAQSSDATCHYCKKPGHFKNACPNRAPRDRERDVAKRTATAEEVRAGACARPGHKHHKASECKQGAPPAGETSSSASFMQENSQGGFSRMISLGVAHVQKVPLAPSTATAAVSASSAMATSANSCGSIVLDSGAGTTVIPISTTLLDGQAASDTQITVANGAVLSSPLRGTAVLRAGATTFLVKNALQHPHIDRPLLSVSSVFAGESKVKRVVFEAHGGAAMTATGEIVFTASQVGGIYVLEADPAKSAALAQTFAAATLTVAAAVATDKPPASRDLLAAPHTAAQLWHQRLCHRSYDHLRLLVSSRVVRGLESLKVPPKGTEHDTRCGGCAEGKAHRQAFAQRMDASREAQHVLARISADVAGPIAIDSLTGARYFLVLLDEWSQFGAVFFLAHKSEAADHITCWCRQARTRHDREVVVFHSDGGGEFVNAALSRFFGATGTQQTTTVPHTPQHNGRAERLIRTLAEWARAAIAHAGAPKKFWAHAIHTALYVRNHTQVLQQQRARDAGETDNASAAAQHQQPEAADDLAKAGLESVSTPIARWLQLSTPVSLDKFRVWGCDADVVFTVAPGLKLAKLDSKSRLCMFLGYSDEKNAWVFYDPATAQVVNSRDANFYERQFTVSHATRAEEQSADDDAESVEEEQHWLTRTTFDNETRLMQLISREDAEREAAERAVAAGGDSDADEGGDQSHTDDESASPSSHDREADASSSSSPARAPISSSSRAPRAPAAIPAAAPRRSARANIGIPENRYGMVNNNLAQGRAVFISLAQQQANIAITPVATAHTGDVAVIPRSYTEAMSSPLWREAVSRELDAHQQNGTWQFVPLPPGRKAIGSKYVFKLKLNPDGSVERAKARLTAKGCSQVPGSDYTDTFAPTLFYNTLRAVLAIVAAEDYELHHLDVETAFLNARVQEDLYMQVPEGVDAPANTVCKLHKALYGIKQAPHEWHAEIASTLQQLGYTASTRDPCLFFKRSQTGRTLLFPLFVDDCFPACHTADLTEMCADKQRLMRAYKIKDSGDASLLLGIRVTRDRQARTLRLDQEMYVTRLLSEYDMSECKPASTPEFLQGATEDGGELAPIASSSSTSSDSSLTNGAPDASLREWYGALVGALLYLALATRPDIAHAVNRLSRALVAPTDAHRVAALRVLRYLKATPALGITLGGRMDSRPLVAFSDANWASKSPDDARSTSGWLLKIGSGPVCWASKKQSVTALSSTESEYIAAALAAREVVWLRDLLLGIGVASTRATTLFCDNRAAKSLAESPNVGSRSKHINTRFHYLRECVQDGSIAIEWLPSEQQPADLFTKALGAQVFLRLRGRVMGDEC